MAAYAPREAAPPGGYGLGAELAPGEAAPTGSFGLAADLSTSAPAPIYRPRPPSLVPPLPMAPLPRGPDFSTGPVAGPAYASAPVPGQHHQQQRPPAAVDGPAERLAKAKALRRPFRVKPDLRGAAALGLDVWTYADGFLRMSPSLLAGFVLLLLGGLCLIYEILLLNSTNIDWRDMLYDYRVTIAGVNAGHANFTAALAYVDLTKAVSMGGISAAMALVSSSGGGGVDVTKYGTGGVPTIAFAPEPTSCANTGPWRATYASGLLTLPMAAFQPSATLAQTAQLVFDPGSAQQPGGPPPAVSVPLYSVGGSFEPGGTVTVSQLSAVKASVSFSALRDACCRWGLDAAVGTYAQIWSGSAEALAAASVGAGGAVPVPIELHDVGEPAALRLPAADGTRTLVGLALLGAGVLLWLAWGPFLFSHVHAAVRLNNNLPPYCWRSRVEFRGW